MKYNSRKKWALSDLFCVKVISVKASRKKLGENIKRIRQTQGASQKQLAFESGVTRELISQIERGQTNVTHDVLHSIAAALDVQVKDLYDFR